MKLLFLLGAVSSLKINQNGIFSQMEKVQNAEATLKSLKLEKLKRKQRDLEEWEREHEKVIALEEKEKERKEKQMIELAISSAKKYKNHGGIDNFIDVQSQAEIENILMENSATLLKE